MKGRKKINKYLILLVVLLAMGIGFAALSTTLRINGTTNISGNTWNIYWDEDSIIMNPNSKSLTPPTVSTDANDEYTILNWTSNLGLPGDFYEFSINAVNAGTLDAMIMNINEGIPDDLVNYISCSVTYADGYAPSQYHKLRKAKGNIPTKQRYKVRVEFLDTITLAQLEEMPDDGLSYTFSYEVQYVQADNRAITKPTFFGTATWDQIIAEYNGGDLHHVLQDDMEQEALRDIELDLDHDGTPESIGHLRIANLSKPDECAGENYSQSACGFVIEFADILEVRRMNYYNTSRWAETVGEGTWGGWEYSDIRAYLNGGTYTRENINYSTSSFLLAMPNDIRNMIIDTKLTSSNYHGSVHETSFVTDKLYYISPTEIWGHDSGNPEIVYDSNSSRTRQLDYYNMHMLADGISEDKLRFDAAIKESINDNMDWPAGKWPNFWGLRESYAYGNWDSSFFRSLKDGSLSMTQASYKHGVSPAFRIAN